MAIKNTLQKANNEQEGKLTISGYLGQNKIKTWINGIFQYFLAYADEPRIVSYIDAQGRLQNAQFNRYDFLERDENGEYYYNAQYLFGTDATGDVEQSRETIWQENRLNFQNGCYGDPKDINTLLIFWQQMEKHHYPDARDGGTPKRYYRGSATTVTSAVTRGAKSK